MGAVRTDGIAGGGDQTQNTPEKAKEAETNPVAEIRSKALTDLSNSQSTVLSLTSLNIQKMTPEEQKTALQAIQKEISNKFNAKKTNYDKKFESLTREQQKKFAGCFHATNNMLHIISNKTDGIYYSTNTLEKVLEQVDEFKVQYDTYLNLDEF